MQLDWPILSVLVWLPIAAGVLLLLVGDRNAALGRWLALAASLAAFLVSVLLWREFDTSTASMQFFEQQPWIGAFNAWYTLGVDGISMPLIVLTTFITPLVVIAGWTVIEKRPTQYFAAFLILEGLMIGVFAALDAMLFYVLWEAMLIPMFVIIGVWGGPRRVYATVKFFLYTFLGSVLMLVALIYMYLKGGSYSIADLQALPLTMREQVLIFTAFLVAFAVKVPMWPVHTWLPDAHVEAPTGGSVILAAIMLKMGGYGFLRFSLPMTPDAAHELDWLVITLSLTAVSLGAPPVRIRRNVASRTGVACGAVERTGLDIGLFLRLGRLAGIRQGQSQPGGQFVDLPLEFLHAILPVQHDLLPAPEFFQLLDDRVLRLLARGNLFP